MVKRQINRPDDKTLAALYPAIGELVISFSTAEQALEDCVYAIYSKHVETIPLARKLPRSLTQKLLFLRKFFESSSILTEHKADAFATLKQVESLADDRNFLIHGAIVGSEAPHSLVFRKVTYDPASPSEERSYSIRDLTDFGHIAAMAAANAMFLAHFLGVGWPPTMKPNKT